MRSYFVDAWYLIARTNRFDGDHAAALRIERAVGRADLVTHDGVLSEVLTYFGGYGRSMRERAAATVRSLLLSYDVLPSDRPLFLRALDRYERRPDKEYSLVDCMSMVVMLDRGITHVLTNDHHFEQEGFNIVGA